jgi:hypothetical protein
MLLRMPPSSSALSSTPASAPSSCSPGITATKDLRLVATEVIRTAGAVIAVGDRSWPGPTTGTTQAASNSAALTSA